MDEQKPDTPAGTPPGEGLARLGLGDDPLGMIMQRWLAVITRPHLFFADMPSGGGFTGPLTFAVAVGLAAGIVRIVVNFIEWGHYITAGWVLLAIILTPVFMVLGSFIGGGILYLIWQALGSKASFEISYRCTAYVMAIAPVTVILRLIPYAGGVLSLVWGFGLLVIASEKVHGISRNKAMIVFGIIFAVLALFSLTSEYHARHLVNELSNWHINLNDGS